MLTTSYHVNLAAISALNGFTTIENTFLKPLDSLRQLNEVVLTDFTSLIDEWKIKFNENACIYDPAIPTSTNDEDQSNHYLVYPNPFTNHIEIQHNTGNEFYELMNSSSQTVWNGLKIEEQNFSDLNAGIYFLRILNSNKLTTIKLAKI